MLLHSWQNLIPTNPGPSLWESYPEGFDISLLAYDGYEDTAPHNTENTVSSRVGKLENGGRGSIGESSTSDVSAGRTNPISPGRVIRRRSEMRNFAAKTMSLLQQLDTW
jgi:hypothetical protein